jgi:hypothetical protein
VRAKIALLVLLVSLASTLVARRADAYRPFDGTDADVAELGHFELELGPSHFYRQGDRNYLIAPATVLNFGILPGTELVIDFQNFVALGAIPPGDSRVALLDTDILVKHVFREGILQGKTGLSIAAEMGPLTPEINGTNAFGASADVITSYRWDFGTFHWNEWAEYTRDHKPDLYTGVILEGPHDWVVRPVSELYYDREFDVVSTWSALVGAIWEADEAFVLDLGVRGARIGSESAEEIRLGLTLSLPMWEAAKPSEARIIRHREM